MSSLPSPTCTGNNKLHGTVVSEEVDLHNEAILELHEEVDGLCEELNVGSIFDNTLATPDNSIAGVSVANESIGSFSLEDSAISRSTEKPVPDTGQDRSGAIENHPDISIAGVSVANESIGSFSLEGSALSRSTEKPVPDTGQDRSGAIENPSPPLGAHSRTNGANITPTANSLRDVDFPMGRGFPQNHHKRIQLIILIKRHAPEYYAAARDEGFDSEEHGRFLRSKTNIIKSVIIELMPINEGGRCMIKKNGVWAVSSEHHMGSQKMRNVVSQAFNYEIKSWGGIIPPMEDTRSVASSKFSLEADTSQSTSKFLRDILGNCEGRAPNNGGDRSISVVQQEVYSSSTSSPEVNDKRSRASDYTPPSTQPVPQRRRFLGRAQEMLALRRSSSDSFMARIANVLGSISLGDPSTISSLSRSNPTTVSDDAHKKGKLLQVPRSVLQSPAAVAPEPTKSGVADIVQIPDNVAVVKTCMGASQGDASTLGSVGYGRAGGKSVKRLLSDLKKSTLRVRTIKQVLDELTHRAISEDTELMSEASVLAVLERASVLMEHQAHDVNVKTFCLVGQLFENLKSVSVSASLVQQLVKWMCWGCETLGSDKYSDGERDKDGIHHISQAMQRYEQHAEVQRWGCYTLRQMVSECPQIQKMFTDARGVGVIVKAMRQHVQHAGVQEWGCRTLGHLAVGESNRREIMHANGIGVIVQAMRQHSQRAIILEGGCDALARCAKNHTTLRRAIVVSNGHNAIQNAVRQHPNSSGIQKDGRVALRLLQQETRYSRAKRKYT